MCCKTVLKSILKYAPKSIAMQNLLKFDQAVVKTNTDEVEDLTIDAFTPDYVDNEGTKAQIADAAAAAVPAPAPGSFPSYLPPPSVFPIIPNFPAVQKPRGASFFFGAVN